MKLTKNELRLQQLRLTQLQKYLPTLQLKKMLLQSEVNAADQTVRIYHEEFIYQYELIKGYAALLSSKEAIDLFPSVAITHLDLDYENIAGVELPIFKAVIFEENNHLLFDAPIWLHAAIKGIRVLLEIKEKQAIAQKRTMLLQKELKEVSTRVNLFEKILIPRAKDHIRKIRIFLGDQQLAAICQAKVAKAKILSKERELYD
ncbi:MAG: V-type ATP synthase subunit D [Candidatus Rhabdochlamydia sp.]